MLGEHPEMYGFPELHMFGGDTVREVLDNETRQSAGQNYAGPPGLIRALAQLHDGVQTTGTIIRAIAWLRERTEWSSKQLLDYLFTLVAPAVAMEKSPPTSSRYQRLERVHAYYPDAFYLHLTRHPIPNRSSLQEFQHNKRERQGAADEDPRTDHFLTWYLFHANIIQFTSSLPSGQVMRVKGEDILSEPDAYLPQIAEWMGLRTDRDAIEAMKHPENSPYASVGPRPASGGNDPKFMRSPKLRAGRVKEPSLEDFFAADPQVAWFGESFRTSMEEHGVRPAEETEIREALSEMAAWMGYF